ncbi:MAG: hypothetical protein OXK73_12320 [Rhodospirillaceae bacterium]|nr:hypothetical protein [Rhodospirillaceae bacterium]
MSYIRLCNNTAAVPEGRVGHDGPSFTVNHGGQTTQLGPGIKPDLQKIKVPLDRQIGVSGEIEGSELLIANDAHLADVHVTFVAAGGRVENHVIRRGEWRLFTA